VTRARYRTHRRRYGRRFGGPAPVLLVTGDDRGALVAAVAHTLWRYRSELAPATTALSLAVLAAWAHARHPVWAVPIAVLTAALSAALAVPPRRWPVGRWVAARLAVAARPAERLYAASVVGLAGAWLAAGTAFGPSRPSLPTVALLGTLAAGAPWWVHRRRRARVRVERTIAAWPTFADAVGLPGSTVASAVVDRWGWTARLALRRGQTARHAVAQTGAIESALGVRPGAVRIEPDPVRADRAVLRVVEADPHAQPIPWREPGSTTVTTPVQVGVFEDGSPITVRLLGRNALVGGIVGAGKSGVLNVLLAALAGCRDVAVWGIDLKGGMELNPWAGCLGRLATTPADAVTLLTDAVAELDRRADLLRTAGQRLWQPGRDRPALIVVIDEYAELPDQAHPLADSLARRGRAVAVTLLAATQRPTQKAMGHGAVRSQMDTRICLRVREPRDADLILGQGRTANGWHAHALDQPGKFLLSDPEHDIPRPGRAYLITDPDVTRTAARHSGNRPTILTTRPEPAPSGPAAQPKQEPAGPTVDRTAQAEAALWAALREAAEPGLSVADLEKITGMGRRWVYYRLRRHAQTGHAIQTARGRWRASHSPTSTHPT
jgi:S-DNA-T family DNA segregation ATPase FtsK/SpoIIIE